MSKSEMVAKVFINSNEEVQEKILSFLNEEEKQVFLEYVGFYKLFNDSSFYEAVQSAIAKEFYKECNQ